MLENISKLGRSIDKAEQKFIRGGKLPIEDPFGEDNNCYPGVQCLNQWGRCTHIMNCNCVDESLNHYSCKID